MVKVKQRAPPTASSAASAMPQKKREVGSLLLGLYDDEACSTMSASPRRLPAKERAALTKTLEKLVEPPGFTGNAPGGPSRWATARSTANGSR